MGVPVAVTPAHEFKVSVPQDVASEFVPFVSALSQLRGFHGEASFNQYCKAVIRAWHTHVGADKYGCPLLRETLAKIGEHNPVTSSGGSIVTSWGGVLIRDREPIRLAPGHVPKPYRGELVHKWLAVKDGGYLALERHRYKEETLVVEQGAGFILAPGANAGELRGSILLPGNQKGTLSRIELNPVAKNDFGPWHCVVGFGILLFETSSDHLGMDGDLHFQFVPV